MKKTISLMMALAVAGTMAAPALAANDEPMLISPAPAVTQQAQMKVVVKDKTLPTITEGNCTMVQVRAVAEALGFTVTWDAEKKAVNLKGSETQCDLYIGENSYMVYTAIDGAVGATAPFSLGAAPFVKDGSTYVPVDLFVPLYGNDPAVVKTVGDTITIDPEAAGTDDAVQIPNPLTGHSTLAELAQAVGFDVKAPSVPEGYTADSYIDIAGELAEVNFVKGEDSLSYRVSRGEGDNSGDYNIYSNKKTVDVKGVSVEMRGNDKVNCAVWSNGGFAYSLYSAEGVSESDVLATVASVL